MAKKTTQVSIHAFDIIAVLSAVFYMQSVLTVAHHTSILAHNLDAWTKSGPSRVVESPAIPTLIIGLLLCCYSWYKLRRPSVPVVISLTIFATASLFWLSGLRTNFYF